MRRYSPCLHFCFVWQKSEAMASFRTPTGLDVVRACLTARSAMPDSLRPHGRWPTRLLCPWNSPGKNTRVGCHFLLQGIFLTLGLNLCLLRLPHWQVGSLPLKPLSLPTPGPKQRGSNLTHCSISVPWEPGRRAARKPCPVCLLSAPLLARLMLTGSK